MSALQQIIDHLHVQRRDLTTPYLIPGLWIDFQTPAAQNVNPYDFFAQRLQDILDSPRQPVIMGEPGGEWTRYAITYNMFPRLTTAFDHDGSGKLEIGQNRSGWRDTGTLLKAIAFLPFLRSMNFNTVHLLPITAVGQDGKKGTLGSPYAIRNPYKLDENLTEPGLVGVDVETLFKGFMEAAHRLGLRVVMEFVLRTAARDSDWIKEHPEWFYWINADIPDRVAGSRNPKAFGSPIWPHDKLEEIHHRIGRGQLHDLPVPPDSYRKMFTAPPRSENIEMVDGRWYGRLDDGTVARIPGAFTDWPPEDAQPPWTDVTYLRLYDHPDFNYMAYNTLRMYDARIAQPENIVHPLWDAVEGIIPHYQINYGIDGVMLDMGHSLPKPLKQRVVQKARSLDPDFAFWGEDFSIGRHIRDEGYNAVMGYLFYDLHQPEKMQQFIDRISHHDPGITFFTAAENHNTPRHASRQNMLAQCHQALLFMVGLPGMPFICSGFEVFENRPINTGVGFSPDDIRIYPPERLPLFSEYAFDWARKDNLVGAIRYAMHLRRQHCELLSNPDTHTLTAGSSNNPRILVFFRTDEDYILVFAFNMTLYDFQAGEAEIFAQDYIAKGLWGFEGVTRMSERLSIHVELGGGHSMMFKVNNR